MVMFVENGPSGEIFQKSDVLERVFGSFPLGSGVEFKLKDVLKDFEWRDSKNFLPIYLGALQQ